MYIISESCPAGVDYTTQTEVLDDDSFIAAVLSYI